VVAPVEQRVEHRERLPHPRAHLLHACPVRIVLLELILDRVRRDLPDLVEPFDEHVQLRAPSGIAWEQRRLGPLLLEVAQDPRGVGNHTVAVHQHRHQPLAAHLDDGRPV
jgi:hypothetical protein